MASPASSNKCTKIENKIPIRNVFTSSEMMINETWLGWRFVKRGWQQDSQGAFELESKTMSSSRKGRRNALRMNRITVSRNALYMWIAGKPWRMGSFFLINASGWLSLNCKPMNNSSLSGYTRTECFQTHNIESMNNLNSADLTSSLALPVEKNSLLSQLHDKLWNSYDYKNFHYY